MGKKKGSDYVSQTGTQAAREQAAAGVNRGQSFGESVSNLRAGLKAVGEAIGLGTESATARENVQYDNKKPRRDGGKY
jgi:hypothetical protein